MFNNMFVKITNSRKVKLVAGFRKKRGVFNAEFGVTAKWLVLYSSYRKLIL